MTPNPTPRGTLPPVRDTSAGCEPAVFSRGTPMSQDLDPDTNRFFEGVVLIGGALLTALLIGLLAYVTWRFSR